VVTREELLALVDERREEVRDFLLWARDTERAALDAAKPSWSLRLENRPDIPDAADAATLFPERWWGLVVFTAFGSKVGAAAAAAEFRRPLPEEEARAALERIDFPPRSVGHHRSRPGLKGAKRALVSASEDSELFHDALHVTGEPFEARYARIRSARLLEWGRTTTFDLFLRAGALGIGGETYRPTSAYLAESTGPRSGFEEVWGRPITRQNADWGEALLRAWTEHWFEVAERVGVDWDVGAAYDPGTFENSLCTFRERRDVS
jgi:hypothetical protein